MGATHISPMGQKVRSGAEAPLDHAPRCLPLEPHNLRVLVARPVKGVVGFVTIRKLREEVACGLAGTGTSAPETKKEGGAEAPPLRNPDDTQCIILKP